MGNGRRTRTKSQVVRPTTDAQRPFAAGGVAAFALPNAGNRSRSGTYLSRQHADCRTCSRSLRLTTSTTDRTELAYRSGPSRRWLRPAPRTSWTSRAGKPSRDRTPSVATSACSGLESAPADFVVAEATARRVGNTWAQVSALAWIAALNPNPRAARWLVMLLYATGWRRLVLVPPEVAADAALGLASLGLRGQAIVELASTAGRPNVLLDVSLRHIDDTAAPLASRLAAVEALGTLGTTRAADVLARLGRRNDELGRRARIVSDRKRRTGLTEREIEVLQLARVGGTNREIAEQLSLSQHTIARHLANARAKLGAANRTEAAMKLDELEV